MNSVSEGREAHVVIDDRDAAGGPHARDDGDQGRAVDPVLRTDLDEPDPGAQQRLGERDRLGPLGIDQRVHAP